MTNGLALDGVLIGAVMFLLGAGLLLAGLGKLRTGLSLYRTDTTPLREVPQADGPVEFDGAAVASAEAGAFTAPFSGEEARLCQLWVEKASTHYTDDEEGLDVDVSNSPVDGTPETTWGLAETDEIRREFVVSDGGRVAVDPTDADLDITGHMGEQVHKIGRGERLSEDVRDRLAELDGDDSMAHSSGGTTRKAPSNIARNTSNRTTPSTSATQSYKILPRSGAAVSRRQSAVRRCCSVAGPNPRSFVAISSSS